VKPYRLLSLLWIGALALLHLWMIGSGHWPLSVDEAHYWEWARRLDWSYYSKPPLVAYLIALSTRLGGDTEFWVRLPAVLLALALSGIAYALAARIFQSARAGFLSVVLLSVMPLFAVGSVLMTIDPPFVFCWGLTWWALLHAVSRPGPMGWYAAGLAFGLGLLSKPTMFMMLPCVVLWLASTPRLHLWFRRREPVEALLLGLLLWSPVVIWNARHGWPTFQHVLGQTGAGELRPLWTSLKGGPEFFASQLGVVSPILFLLFIAGTAWAWREGRRQQRADLLLLVCASAPVLLFFQAWSFLSKVQANWPAHAYLTAAVATAGWFVTRSEALRFRRQSRGLNRTLVASILLPAVLLPIGFAPDLLETVGLPVPTALDLVSKRLRGWPELGQAVGEVLQTAPAGTFLVSDRYQIASQLAFYVTGNPRVYNANMNRRMNQYDLWGGWETLLGRDGLFVTYGVGGPPDDLRAAFREVRMARIVPITHRGRHLRDFAVFHGIEFRGFPPRPFAGY
jgi:4-amino-4-deoxy-L-arabinose transferase-like glycosyltransferase